VRICADRIETCGIAFTSCNRNKMCVKLSNDKRPRRRFGKRIILVDSQFNGEMCGPLEIGFGGKGFHNRSGANFRKQLVTGLHLWWVTIVGGKVQTFLFLRAALVPFVVRGKKPSNKGPTCWTLFASNRWYVKYVFLLKRSSRRWIT